MGIQGEVLVDTVRLCSNLALKTMQWGTLLAKEISDRAFETIHAKQNAEKYENFFVGFLYGVVASGKIDSAEAGALKAICVDVLSKFIDDDANDIIQDLEAFPDEPDQIRSFLQDIIDDRTGGIETLLNTGSIPRNFFYGYLKGIACDNTITLKELQGLIELGRTDILLAESDPRITEVLKYADYAIEDVIISEDESDEICEYISRIVGDAYADTGVGLPTDRPNLSGTVHKFDDIEFKDNNFVLTGSFSVPKKVFAKIIEAKGGTISNSVSRKVDYVVSANSGSRDYVLTNSGTKILKAVELQKKYGKPNFIVESTLRSLLND